MCPDPGPDVAQQRLIAGERRVGGLAAKARAVSETTAIGADDVDDLAGVLVDRIEFARVVPKVAQAENVFGPVDGRVETRERRPRAQNWMICA